MLFWKKKKINPTPLPQESTPTQFDTTGLETLLHAIKRDTGVDLFSKNSIIETKLKLFCQRKSMNSFRELHEKIAYDKSLYQDLIDLVTVNETYFYREESQLELSVNFALALPNVKILCAPCASGEEVYSLAMMLSEKNRSSNSFSITGIDINAEAIEKAQKGTYSERSLHKLSPALKEKFFTADDKAFRIRKECFPSLYFQKFNIFEPSFGTLGQFDIIFSRNMLIYFDDEFRLKTIEVFAKMLKAEGKLFLGHADIVPENRFFEKRSDHRLSYYVKR
jgi:chemotaxis protein methyltransferase CheR